MNPAPALAIPLRRAADALDQVQRAGIPALEPVRVFLAELEAMPVETWHRPITQEQGQHMESAIEYGARYLDDEGQLLAITTHGLLRLLHEARISGRSDFMESVRPTALQTRKK